MVLIIPKFKPNRIHRDRPVIFLAGPVRGGGNWQERAYLRILSALGERAVVVTPVRYGAEAAVAIPMDHDLMLEVGPYPHQTAWERDFLELAGDPRRHPKGCILFWLGCEDEENPNPGPGPYSMDTRGELGEWRGRMMSRRNLRVVVGADAEYHGLRAVQRNFDLALRTSFRIHTSLEETVDAAIARAR